MRPLLSALVLLDFVSAGTAIAAPAAKVTYKYSRHGNSSDSHSTPLPTVVLSGGGTDVDESIVAMCKGNQGGDFLVLGTETFNKYYYSYIRNTCDNAGYAANSVSMLIVPDLKAANDPFVEAAVASAEAIWIAGGDQSKYFSQWSNSRLQSALNNRVNKIAIGGISAGMNVLAEFVYTASGTTSVTSTSALANPNDPNITLARRFLTIHVLAGAIGDPHFVTRDRMGRDLAFLYRIYNTWSGTVARSISVDEDTALIITGAPGNWTATVVGSSSVYLVQPNAGSIPPTLAGGPLTGMYNVPVYRFAGNSSFAWPNGSPMPTYTISVDTGALQTLNNGGAVY